MDETKTVLNKPFKRGLWLAVASAVILILAGRIDFWAAYGQIRRLMGEAERADFFLAMAVMMIPGAFLAALPGRLRRKGVRRVSTGRGCLACFLGGLVMILAAGLAGGGDGMALTGLLQGNISAYVFVLAAWLAGLTAARIRMGKEGRGE